MKDSALESYLRQLDARETRRRGIARRRASETTAPLSFSQQQLWLHARHAPDVPLYSEPITIHRHGRLDVAALERSLTEILRRHEAWRTTFVIEHGQPIQMIHPPPTITLPVVDLTGLPEAEREAEALRLATADALRPFDLRRGPLVRTRLVRLRPTEHRLFLGLHHIIFDGVSIYHVLLPELTALYAAFSADKPSPLAEPPVQYADFALWQRERVEGETVARQLAYWRGQLAGSPVLQLPTDHPRGAVQAFQGAMERLTLSRPLTDALKALGRSEGATLYMTVLAAFFTLLHRYSGQDDIVVGSVSAGRKRPEVERLLGYFLNPLALRVDLSGDPPFRELLGRVREVTLDALANDEVPFERVLNAVRPERDPSRNPLFQVVFSLEPPLPPLEPGWQLTQLDVETGVAKFDLYLELDERPEGVIGRFIYRTDLFEVATVRRAIGHLHTLLEGVVADPNRRLSALPLLMAAEQHHLLVECNDTQTAYPAESTIHRLFEAQAARTPDAVAVVLEDEALTYRELNRRANQLAHHLRALGVGPAARVGVAVERSLEMVIGLLGILKAGGAYVPFDPTYPAERLAFMLQDAGVTALLTQRHLVDRLPATAVATVCLDTDWPRIRRARGENLDVAVGSDDLAYAIYTSGSTGRPKGAAIRHRSVLRLLFGVSYVRLGPGETLLQAASTSFDAATFEIWGALLHGARLVLFPAAAPTPRALADIMRRHGVSTLWLTASLFNSVIETAPEALAGVRQLLIGGEALSVAHVRRALEAFPSLQITNGYGPTETTVFACTHRIAGPPDPRATSIPIGRPIGNTRVYVLDRHRNPVPIGVPGELYIGGPGVARGYLNRPELTAERFVPDPYGENTDDRLYQTGDLVRYLPDGTLDFLGRLDAQVKIRGFRVEPGEVETVLARHPSIRDVTVDVRETAAGDRTLVAYVVLRDGHSLRPPDLKAMLERSLPAYMVPAIFVTLEALPLTPSGKVDRRALPAPGDRRVQARFVAPRDSLEAELARIWEELLNTRPISVSDDFFELGGQSLIAARMMQQIEHVYGRALPLTALYANPTIERLAGALLDRDDAAVRSPLVRIHTDGAQRPLFLFHGDFSGAGFYCLKLARHLGPDQPLYAVHPLGRDGSPMPPTIEAMATALLTVVRSVQPHGPYRLSGYCNGGLVAYEMARRLVADGETVELLALIAAVSDTRWAGLGPFSERVATRLGRTPEHALEWFARFRWFWSRLAEASPAGRIPFLLQTAARLVGGARVRRMIGAENEPESPAHARYFRAVLGYVPGPYPGRIILFSPADEAGGADEPARRWRRLATSVDLHVIPGNHNSIVTDYVDLIAERLRPYLTGP